MTTGSEDTAPDAHHLAAEFADSLSATLNAVLTVVPPVTVERCEPRLFVSPRDTADELRPITTIPLSIDGVRRLNLRVEMYCTLDSRNQYLTVDESKIALELPGSRAEPLIRFEYVRAGGPPPLICRFTPTATRLSTSRRCRLGFAPSSVPTRGR